METRAIGRVTFTKVEDYSIVFYLNNVQCDVLNFDTVCTLDNATFEARFFNGGIACIVSKAVITCYDADGAVLGSPIEVTNTSDAIVDGGNLYLSKNCKNIVCQAYIGDKSICTSSIAIIRDGKGISLILTPSELAFTTNADGTIAQPATTVAVTYKTDGSAEQKVGSINSIKCTNITGVIATDNVLNINPANISKTTYGSISLPTTDGSVDFIAVCGGNSIKGHLSFHVNLNYYNYAVTEGIKGDVTDKYKSLTGSISDTKGELNKTITDKTATINRSIDGINATLNTHQTSITKAQDAADRAQETADKVTTTATDLTTELQATNGQVSSLITKTNQTNTDLNDLKKNTNTSISSINDSYNNLKQTVDENVASIGKNTTDITTNKDNITGLTTRTTSVENRATTLEETVNGLKSTVSSNSTNITTAQTTANEAKANAATAQGTADDAKKSAKDANDAIVTNNAAYTKKFSALEQTDKDISATVTQHTASINGIKGELTNIRFSPNKLWFSDADTIKIDGFNGKWSLIYYSTNKKSPSKLSKKNFADYAATFFNEEQIADNVRIPTVNKGDYYVLYAVTYAKFSADTQVTFTISVDDWGGLYINNEEFIIATAVTSKSITYTFKKGWNKVEAILGEIAGDDFIKFSSKLSSFTNCLGIDCSQVGTIPARYMGSSNNKDNVNKFSTYTWYDADYSTLESKIEQTSKDITISVSKTYETKSDADTKNANTNNAINAAKQSAISTAATDATTKANNAKSDAIKAAATDATTKSANAKSEAISAASADATTKANKALDDAKADATAKANAAQSAAAKDATDKANKAKDDAIAAAKTETASQINVASERITSDVSAKYTDLDGKITEANTKIQQTANGIVSTVTKSDQWKALNDKVDTTQWTPTACADLNTLTAQGKYYITSGALANAPDGITVYALCTVDNTNGTAITQTAWKDTDNAKTYTRTRYNGKWTSWVLLVNNGNVVSTINQTADGVTINASKINFNGLATFSSSNNDLNNAIKDAKSAGTAAQGIINDYKASNNNALADVRATANNALNSTVKDVHAEYATNDSSTTPPTNGWSTSSPTWVNGKFVWQRIAKTLGNNTTQYSPATCITGAQGKTGNGFEAIFLLNSMPIEMLNFDYIASSTDSITLEANFYNNGVDFNASKVTLTCYDGSGAVLGSPIESTDTSNIVVDGGNLYLSKSCKYISCELYQGATKVLTKSLAVTRDVDKVINDVKKAQDTADAAKSTANSVNNWLNSNKGSLLTTNSDLINQWIQNASKPGQQTFIAGGWINTNTITSGQIASKTIIANNIAAGAITTEKLDAGAVTTEKITTSDITGTNGRINLRNGTFSYGDASNGMSWDGKSLVVNGSGTFSGTVTATSGKIAGYTISGNSLIGSNVGICGASGSNWAFWAGSNTSGSAPFHVGHDGSVIATNANITGTITATSGKIANFKISGNYLETTDETAGIGSGTDSGAISFWAGYNKTDGSYKYKVTKDGHLYATDADIAGKITAKSGSIGGININGSKISSSNGNFEVTSEGALTATNATISGNITATGGTIGGITISDNGISAPTFLLTKTGALVATAATIGGAVLATSGTIGGYHITDSSLYSGSKNAYTSTVAGVFLGSDGKINIGSDSSYIKYDGTNIDIKAKSISIGSTNVATSTNISDLNAQVINYFYNAGININGGTITLSAETTSFKNSKGDVVGMFTDDYFNANLIKARSITSGMINAGAITTSHMNANNMPPYYEKGYEAGYDDGEEDAVNENGWQSSYDDSNSYKGKKKHQYEDGYEEGYEAGYDDNHEGPDD